MKPRNASKEIRAAAVKACTGLLMGTGLDRNDPAHRYILKRALNELVWCYSGSHEDAGKYLGCPWWTAGALALFDSGDPDWIKHVALEHVVERKEVIAELLLANSEEQVRQALERSDTCVVLRSEHTELSVGSGWERYKGVEVVPGPRARKRMSLTDAAEAGTGEPLLNA